MRKITVLFYFLLLGTGVSAQLKVEILNKKFTVNGKLICKHTLNSKLSPPTFNEWYLDYNSDTLTYVQLVKRQTETNYSVIYIQKTAMMDVNWSNKNIWDANMGYGTVYYKIYLELASGKSAFSYFYNDSKVEEKKESDYIDIYCYTREDAGKLFDEMKIKIK